MNAGFVNFFDRADEQVKSDTDKFLEGFIEFIQKNLDELQNEVDSVLESDKKLTVKTQAKIHDSLNGTLDKVTKNFNNFLYCSIFDINST